MKKPLTTFKSKIELECEVYSNSFRLRVNLSEDDKTQCLTEKYSKHNPINIKEYIQEQAEMNSYFMCSISCLFFDVLFLFSRSQTTIIFNLLFDGKKQKKPFLNGILCL